MNDCGLSLADAFFYYIAPVLAVLGAAVIAFLLARIAFLGITRKPHVEWEKRTFPKMNWTVILLSIGLLVLIALVVFLLLGSTA